MINDLMNLILLCCTLFLAALCLLMFLGRVKRKKQIFDSISKNKNALNEQYVNDETRLKKIAGVFLTSDLQTKITEIISVEKTNYQNLMALFLDYHPAAIEMLPSMVNNIISAYIDCIQYIILQSQTGITVEAGQEQSREPKSETIDERYQLQALIEQLRHEKQQLSDRYHQSQQLISLIYQKYKEKLDINQEIDSLNNLKLEEMATLFKVDMP